MKLLLLLSAFFAVTFINIYSFNISTNKGRVIKLSDYQNKKMLIVNIATSGSEITQLAELELFHQMHKDSILVIAFPSNSFEHTDMNDQQIRAFLTTQGVTFPVAYKTNVEGSNAHPLYQWLMSDSSNASLKIKMEEDFQKILIGKDGKIKGAFGAPIRPGSDFIKGAIRRN
ncbi:MAG: hypothetical protein K2Q24_08900 [Chitinophagaceae bacterium]|jgi:glutathione peroxidase|nr:hypothetical protein [Chitinophagaceae bacterium]